MIQWTEEDERLTKGCDRPLFFFTQASIKNARGLVKVTGVDVGVQEEASGGRDLEKKIKKKLFVI